MVKVLLAEDEAAIRKGYAALLESAGYSVLAVKNGEEAVRDFVALKPTLVILDCKMPKMDGFRACQEIRRQNARVPIIFLTANDSEANEVRAIGLGGDDFISKADSDSVLLARLARAIERQTPEIGAAGPLRSLRLGEVFVDFVSLDVTDGARHQERLTRTEADVLALLASSRGSLFSADQIIAFLRGAGFSCEDSMVYVHISNLRRKLGPAARFLASRRGAGYCLSI